MANPVSSIDVPLSIFGSLDTELSPPDIPEGGSPANNDVVYTPGAVATRPGLNRVFALPIDALGPVSYEKSFVLPNGNVKNLYLTMTDGTLWVEDVTNNPDVVTQLFQSAGATYASSCTAQGREYIAFSNGQTGVDIPLQYDGTNLWRVTQDGPGAAPAIVSVALPPTTMAASGAAPTTAISTITPEALTYYGRPPYGTSIYTQVAIAVASSAGILPNGYVTVSGSTELNGTYVVLYTVANVVYCSANLPAGSLSGTGGTLTIGASSTLIRTNNSVLCTTSAPHGLQKGYQAQIQGAGTTVVGGTISSIVLDNEDTPGLATVTMSQAHGLLPNNQVNIQGVTGKAVGTAISNVAFAGNFVTITTSAAHGLSIGSEVIVAAVTNTTVNGQWTVAAIPSATTFTYAFVSIVTAYSASDSGTVTYLWPLANTDPAQNYFTVQTAPSATTFTIALSYTDGTWTGGTVSFQWDGTFFVTAILSTTQFTYQQYGPNTSTTQVGTVTPYGQATPGIHQLQVSFLRASGAITKASPFVQFVANGGQYLSVTNIPTGPSDVVGRILQFTGAGGAYFYYIPVPAQVNGLLVSTATQINDNTTTSALLDFSDNTLYAATSVSKAGNNLPNLVVLPPQAGMFSYASRLLSWGGYNRITNLLNMSFSGNGLRPTDLAPDGWTSSSANFSAQAAPLGRPGGCIQFIGPISSPQFVSQSAYLDCYGAPIALGSQQYSLNVFLDLAGTAGTAVFFASFTSATTGFSSVANVTLTGFQSGFYTVQFSLPMPVNIPADLLFNVGVASMPLGTFSINEMSVFYTDEPYLQNESWISYATNLEGMDAETGTIGPEDDLSPIRNFGVIRQALYIVTGTGLHETEDNDQTEPSGWDVDQVADNCGAFSIASVGRNPQGIGSAGKDWMVWSGPDGAQLFTGQKPFKISQEIQSVWDAIPASAQYRCWVKNNESSKWCFFGIPTTGSSMQVMVLDYRNIDGAAIAENPPIHISFTGKMIVSDLTRKWTSCTIPAWCGELMYRANQTQPQIVFGCLTPAGAANCYTLNALQYNDDDFGTIPASYTTYFFVSHEMEQALQVGSHRHIYTLAQAFISCIGTWSITPLAASLSNAFPTSLQYPGSLDPHYDIDFGINVNTTRCAFRIQASPTDGLNAYFKLQKLVINMAKDPNAPVRGSVSGQY